MKYFATKSSAKEEVARRSLTDQLNAGLFRGAAKYNEIPEHYIAHELLAPMVVKPNSHNTLHCYVGNMRR